MKQKKNDEKLTGELMKIIIDLRQEAKINKEWTSRIRSGRI